MCHLSQYIITQCGHSLGKEGNQGKSQGKIFLMKKSGKFTKNFIRQGKMKLFLNLANVLENVDIAHFISIFCQIKDKSYKCYFFLYFKQIRSREKPGKIETLKMMATLL